MAFSRITQNAPASISRSNLKKTTENRIYPVYREGMSTAQYVEWYENVNKTLRKWSWEPLSTTPTLASGEDAAWEVDDVTSDF